MKTAIRPLFFLVALILVALDSRLTSTCCAQQVLINDQFNGTSIDSSVWMTGAPYSNSSITENGGSAIFQNRGQLVTQNELPASLVITGRFTITSPVDQFKIVLRTDGTFGGEYDESNNGICVLFQGPAAQNPSGDEIIIFDLTSNLYVPWTGTLNPGTAYDFKIIDDGFTIAVYLTDMDTPKVVANSTNVYGDHLAIYNRFIDGYSIETQLDHLQVAYGSAHGSTTDLWDVSNGTTIVDYSPIGDYFNDPSRPFNPGMMFGAVSPTLTREPDDIVFVDSSEAGYVYYMEWKTASPVTVRSFDLYAAPDSGSESREFQSMRLLAKSSGSSTYDLVLANITPAHPYEYFDANHQLLISSDIPTTTAQDFRVEFVNLTGETYTGPRIFELDGFGTTSEQNHTHAIAGPVTNPSNGHSYYLLDSSTWMNAEAQAVGLGGHLATVRSTDENQWIVDQFGGGSTENRRLWIGYHRPANATAFVWASNESATYTDWCSGEPNQDMDADAFTYIVQPVADPNFPDLVPGEWNDTFDTDTGSDGREPFGVVEVNAAVVPAITSATAASATQNVPFSYRITATGNPTKYAASALPTGLTLTASTGLISGTPKNMGKATVTISATNAEGTGSAKLTLTIAGPPVITSATSATATTETAFRYQIAATNNPTKYTAPGLPTGLTLDSATGLISGAPENAGTAVVTIGATNGAGTGTEKLTLTIKPGAPVITSATSETASTDTAFSYQITATNHPTSYQASGLPTGLTLDTAKGLISGTPIDTGTATVTLRAINAVGTGTAKLTLTLKAGAPVITSATTASATVGKAFSYRVTATLDPKSYGASGLPTGLSLNTTTGLISGTPKNAGKAAVTISATNAAGTGTAKVTLTITD